MATNPPSDQLRPADLDPFLAWYAERRRRAAGSVSSPATLRTRRSHVMTAARVGECPDIVTFGTLLSDRDRVEHLLDALAARMTPGSLRALLYSLMAFGDFAVARGIAGRVALRRDDIPPPNPLPAITVYSAEEVDRLVSAARGRDLRWWAFLSVLSSTGRRVGEVLSLRWDWFRLEETPPYIELPVNKTRKPQLIPLARHLHKEVFSDENILRLMHEQRNGRRAFHRSSLVHPFPWAYATVHLRFRSFCDVVGVPNRGFHTFRHTKITERLARGVPIHAVAALAGHSSVAVTDRRYNHATALNFANYLEDEP